MLLLKQLEELAQKDIYIFHTFESLGSDEWEIGYQIKYLPKEAQDLKRRTNSFVTVNSFTCPGATYSGAWPTITEALEEGIKYANKVIVPLV